MLQAQTKEIIMLQRLNALPTTSNKDLILTVMGVALMFICSQYSIPMQPVPITLSILGVLLIGLTYTPKQVAYSVGGWILLGAVGFPMFAGFKSGIPALLGPTGGYIVGFFFAAFAMACLARLLPTKAWWGFTINSLVGAIISYAFGLSWLAHLIGWEKAWQFGFVPFIMPDLLKAIFLSGAIYGIKFFRAK
jgi:biotin transport system substrate-specific component